MTPTEVLIAARDLIADPDHWCQHELALNVDGETVDAAADEACRWCAEGALYKVTPIVADRWAALRTMQSVMDDAMPVFNDSHTHAEVLAAFDRAIEATT